MRKLLCLVLLAACELQPAPKKQPPTQTPPSAVPVNPVEAPPIVVDAGVQQGSAGSAAAAPKIEISAPCMEVAAKVAQVLIDTATDPALKSVYEQERTKMTRKTGEACTTQAWSEEARNCYLKTKTPAAIKACETKFTPPPRAPNAGSAAQPGEGSGMPRGAP